jgi:hypothetical protein
MKRWRSSSLLLAALAGGLGLAGCGGPFGWVRVTVNRPLKPQDVAFIVPHRTRWDEITRRLGAPDELVRTADGVAADYLCSDGKSFRVNFGWPLGFVAPVSYAPHDFTLGGQGIGSRTFEVAFDARDVVVYAGFVPGAPASKFRLWPFSSPGP